MGIILRHKSTDRCLIGEKMTEFESRIDDSSESDQRSRSDRVVSHALQVRVGTPSEPTISESMSTPDERRPVPNQLQIATNTNQSPDATLSQFLQPNEHSPQVPRNPFQSPPAQGLVLNGHRVSHFPKRMFEMSCMYPWIRLSLHKPTKLLNKLIVLWPNPVMS